VGSSSSGTPNPIRTIAAGTWQTIEFFLQNEPVTRYTGDGVLSTASGLAVLEHLAIKPANTNAGSYEVYIDNVEVISSNRFSFSLGNAAPTNAVIDSVTGALCWTPSQFGRYQIPVLLTDLINGDVETNLVSIDVLPTIALTSVANAPALTWRGESLLQAATNLSGPFSTVTTNAPYIVPVLPDGQLFFRLLAR
jgi:hypothetical protein